ncbi:TAXI family TRAP transporter solute-binding subunit [Shumkonia mesophila]|uniref:TAXI family TRAP transporter solute-binding subunit n=1 Tax=Shumkonia mesophila TaxID=2838854 RepID=UPI002934EB77|nr:TAXI family TRAP transporter solute-binding subunit [Shumkonia mesophila]
MTGHSRAKVLCVALAGVAMALAGPAQAKPKQVTIFTSLAGSTWYGIGAGMAKIFGEGGVQSNAELGAALSNIVNVVEGKGEIGLTMTAAVSMAEAGDPPFKGKIDKVAGLIGLSPSYLQIAVAKDDNIMGVGDLKGKRFVTQPKGAITAEVFSRTLKAYGLSESDLDLSRGSLDVQIDQMKDRHAKGMVSMASFPASFFSELANAVPLRMLPISDAAFAKIAADMPGLAQATIPANTYSGQGVPVPTVISKMVGVISADMLDDDAYWLAKALVDNLQAVRELHSSYKDLTPADFASIPGVRLHPGAARYYREKGVLK